MQPTVSVLSPGACGPGLALGVNEQRWRSPERPKIPDLVPLSVHRLRRATPWRGEAERLVARLREVWPDRIVFHDGMGRPMAEAEAMRGRPEATNAE